MSTDQPRRPAGTPAGGQFDRGAGSGAAADLTAESERDPYRVAAERRQAELAAQVVEQSRHRRTTIHRHGAVASVCSCGDTGCARAFGQQTVCMLCRGMPIDFPSPRGGTRPLSLDAATNDLYNTHVPSDPLCFWNQQ